MVESVESSLTHNVIPEAAYRRGEGGLFSTTLVVVWWPFLWNDSLSILLLINRQEAYFVYV